MEPPRYITLVSELWNRHRPNGIPIVGLVADSAPPAARHVSQAAEAGEMRAANNLGVCFEKGHGLEQDYEQAAHWYRQVGLRAGCAASGCFPSCQPRRTEFCTVFFGFPQM